MGSAQSYLTPESALGVVIVGAVAFGMSQQQSNTDATPSARKPQQHPPHSASKKKTKRKKEPSTVATQLASATSESKQPPIVVDFPAVVPGDFEPEYAPSVNETRKKKTKNRGKKVKPGVSDVDGDVDGDGEVSADASSDAARLSSSINATGTKAKSTSAPQKRRPSTTDKPASSSLKQSTASIDTDSSWSRVESGSSKFRGRMQPQHKGDDPALTSDAGVTTSTTGNSSPVLSRTEDELSPSGDDGHAAPAENRRTFAEKMLPKPRKTGVEDMLEAPDVPSLSRVIKVVPGPNQQPASGFTWGDYEDVDIPATSNDDADTAEDDGWGIVKSRGRSSRDTGGLTSSHSIMAASGTQTPTSQPQTKRQRQNANKREAGKQAKAESEKERLARLDRHKRELERARVLEQHAGGSGKGKGVSGGMAASIDDKGKLVWD